ncbi:hypothetical protein [Streptomyces sp. NRRL B-1347]|uniref:hypothetical protein n=1 Tax=Streptomyces sp. NRRL B-1347 TaxID=1476877 RepID=UPI0004C5FDD6|nr:hypothetical protein [Streptomyces sp. NRRL B-1347]
MNAPVRSDQPEPATGEQALQDRHLARARSAYARAVAACRAAGIEPDRAEAVPTGPAARAANAVRLAARSIAERAGRTPDPAADARCARNASAAAAIAAQTAHAHTPDTLTTTALKAALTASHTAAETAGGPRPGRDETLTERADATEERAVATAAEAGWTGEARAR